MKAVCMVVLAWLLAGCAATKLPTASGRPEVSLPGPVAAVKARLAGALVNVGYSVTASDDLRVVAEKQAGSGESFALALTVGHGADPNARKRLQFTLVPVGESVRVIGELALVNQGAFGQVNVVPQDRGRGPASVQAFLDSLR